LLSFFQERRFSIRKGRGDHISMKNVMQLFLLLSFFSKKSATLSIRTVLLNISLYFLNLSSRSALPSFLLQSFLCSCLFCLDVTSIEVFLHLFSLLFEASVMFLPLHRCFYIKFHSGFL
jgi:hypothetical protein